MIVLYIRPRVVEVIEVGQAPTYSSLFFFCKPKVNEDRASKTTIRRLSLKFPSVLLVAVSQ